MEYRYNKVFSKEDTIVFSLLAAGLVAGTVAIVIIKRRKS